MTKLIFLLVCLLEIISLVISDENTTEKVLKEEVPSVDATVNLGNQSEPNNETEISDVGWDYENTTSVDNRRILYSKRTEKGKRPYMVYLSLTKESAKAHKYPGWLCGGVIVDHYYVMTSAACVEDADKFYIVSGTTKYVDSLNYKSDKCVCKHRRRVVWKCIPKNYKFDFQDSIKWSSNDIAIVKVDKAFKFGITEEGCEFATCSIPYNNISRELEKPNTKGWIAGWGSGNSFREGVYRRQKSIPKNSRCLQEAKVCIMDNEQCAKKWAQRFREIITQYMICTKDVMKRLSEVCDKRYANCTDVETRRESELEQSNSIDLGRHLRDPDDYTARRSSMPGGFCENDHGGPLIVRYKNKETLIGIISACKIDPKSHSCHGPFLYTSVYRNRQFISCAIHKDVEANCRRVFRSGITHEEWTVTWDEADNDDDADSDSKDALRISDAAADKDNSTKTDEVSTTTEKVEAKTDEPPKEKSEKVKRDTISVEKHKKKKNKKQKKGDTVSYESSSDEEVNNPDKE